MKARPRKGMRCTPLPLWLGLLMVALVAATLTAEMASSAQVARTSTESRLRIARGEEAAGSGGEASELAVISAISLEQATATHASILIQADRPLASYESFALPDPPRLVVDIPNAQHAISSYPSPAPASLVKKIRSSQYKESPLKVVRLVFDLTSPSLYQVEPSGNQLKIAIGEGGKEEVAEAPAGGPPPQEGAAAAWGKVTKIDYQAARDRGRILIFTEGKVAYEISKTAQPPSLIMDIRPAELSIPSTEPLDVHLLPGQVDKVRAVQSQVEPEKVVRVVAELKGTAKYEISQDDKGIIVDILAPAQEARAAAAVPPSPAAVAREEAPPPAEAPAVEAKRISMDFKDADINNLLRILAEVSGANIVAGAEVKGNVTVRLTNVPWDQALEVILKINNYGYIKEGNIIRVASLASINKDLEDRKKREAEEKKAREAERREKVALAPLEQYILAVNYVSAEKLLENLVPLASTDPDTGKPRGKLTLHSETKSIIITDTVEAIEKMKQMASRLDIQTPQVMIEARIITVREDYFQSLGIQWGGSYAANMRGGTDAVIAGSNPYSISTGGPVTGSPDMGTPGGSVDSALTRNLVGSALGAIAQSTGSYILNLPASPPSGSPIAGAVSLGYVGSRLLLDARISLAESEGKVKTLSSPKVATLDNKEAEIKSGIQVPFTTIDPSSGRLTISFQEAYLRLKVKPHVTSDKRVNMEIEAENNTVGRSYPTGVGDVISIDKRIAKTEMLAENGATVVLGGLYVSTESWSEDRVPFLGRIPILGWLFKRRQVNPTRSELLIFITPTIIEERRA
ncbi:MAG: type IV pilus secretin PilQ [candidate division NC10 bacterium]|nr:type IV pilus secretin PilQ [candidate division NC10 bacterium]